MNQALHVSSVICADSAKVAYCYQSLSCRVGEEFCHKRPTGRLSNWFKYTRVVKSGGLPAHYKERGILILAAGDNEPISMVGGLRDET